MNTIIQTAVVDHSFENYSENYPFVLQSIMRKEDESGITPYPEDNDFPPIRPSFYPDSNTVWVRNNTPESTFVRDYHILFDLNNDFPKNKELIIDTLELVLFATGDDSNLTIDLYLDNKLKASIPYGQYYRTVLDLKALGLSEQDRTLSYRKNIMVKFNQNGELYTKMGVCFTSAGVPSGHIKGRLIDKIRPLPLKTCTYLTDHNKNVTGLADEEGHMVANWDYDAFGNIIRQTGPMASSNPLRFSSEYHDEELGMIYYNYRHYNPRDGRWISRDPITEHGGYNLYCFTKNNSSFVFDFLALKAIDERTHANIYQLDPILRTVSSTHVLLVNQKLAQIDAAKETKRTIKIIMSYRSSEEQDELYAQGRTKAGNIVTKAKGGQSAHNYSLAYDIGVFCGSRYLPEDSGYDVAGAIGVQLGLEWGDTYGDKPHFQYPIRDRVLKNKKEEADNMDEDLGDILPYNFYNLMNVFEKAQGWSDFA